MRVPPCNIVALGLSLMVFVSVAIEGRAMVSGDQIYRTSCLTRSDVLRWWQATVLTSWSWTSIPPNKVSLGCFELSALDFAKLDVAFLPPVAALSWREPNAATREIATRPYNKVHFSGDYLARICPVSSCCCHHGDGCGEEKGVFWLVSRRRGLVADLCGLPK